MARRRAVSSLVLAVLAGCGESMPGGGARATDPLPRAVAVIMVAAGKQPVTACFSVVPNPRGHIDVRLAGEILLPNERGLFALRPDDAARTRWTLHETLGGAHVPLALPGTTSVRPLRVEDATAWMFPKEGPGFRCDLHSGECAATEDRPKLEFTHSGPGNGFRLELKDRTLRFRQPHQDDDAPGDIVATRVLDLLSVRWLHDLPDDAVMENVDRTFRGRATLRAAPGAVVVDGDMAEWSTAEPVVVDAPWQVSPRETWHGQSDASFSVAARAEGLRVCFAGRVRDDDLGPGDELSFVLGAERSTLHLASGAFVSTAVAPENLVAVVAKEPFGWHFEACLARPARTLDRNDIAFAACYTDQDANDPPEELATAPIYTEIASGTLEFAP